MTVIVEAPTAFEARRLPSSFLSTINAETQKAPSVSLAVQQNGIVHRIQIYGVNAFHRAAVIIPLDGGEELRIAEVRRFIRYLSGLPVPPLSRALGSGLIL